MFPTLKKGQDILSVNWFYKVRTGDLVVIKINGKEMVKRVQKIAGDHIFVKGDNMGESTDSRHFGPVRKDQIIGKVIYASFAVNTHQTDHI